LLASVIACAALLLPTAARAANINWQGGFAGDANDWDNASNWTGTWLNSNTVLLNIGSSTAVVSGDTTLNLTVATTAQAVTFGASGVSSSNAYTIQSTGGFTLTLDSNGSGSKTPLTNSGTNSETITCPVTITNSAATTNTQPVIDNASSGGLTLTNALAFSGSVSLEGFEQAGTGQITANGGFTGALVAATSAPVPLDFFGTGTGAINFAPTSVTNLGVINIATNATVNFGASLSPTTTGLGNNGGSGTTDGATNTAGILYLTGNGITLSGSMTTTAATSGTLTFGSNYTGATTNTSSGNWALATTATATTLLYSAANNTLALTGSISGGLGTSPLVQTGPGILELSGSNSTASPFTFSATNPGTIEIAGVTLTNANGISNGPVGAGVFNITGGTVEDNGVAQTISNAITLGGTATFADFTPVVGSGLTVASLGTAAGSVSYGNDTFALTANSTLVVTNTTTISAKVTGVGFSLTKTGAGTLNMISASNDTFSGLTVLNGNYAVTGLNNANVAGQSGSESAITLGGPGGQVGTWEDAQASGNGSSTLGVTLATGGGGGMQVDNAGTTVTLSGTISGSGSFAKSGPGSLTLSGATNTFSGGFTISNGTVLDGNANSNTLGSGNLTFGASNTPTLNLDGNSPTIGLLAGTSTNGVITNTVAGTSTLTLNGVGSASFAGSITGTGTKITALALSAGTQTLSGSSNYSGGTTVGGGTLIVTGSLTGSGAVNVTAGTLGGSGLIAAATTIGSGAFMNPGVGLTTGTTLSINNTVTFSAGSAFQVNIDAVNNGVDKLNIGGAGHNLTINGSDTLTFLLVNGSSLDNLAVGTYVIANVASGTINGTGAFAPDSSVQSNWSVVDTGTQLELVVVPEPGTWAMICVGAGLLAVWQRRQRRHGWQHRA